MAFVKVERSGQVAVVRIDRLEALNALNSALLQEIAQTFSSIAQDAEVRAVVLTGEGKAFVAGADIAEMKDLSPSEAHDYAVRGAAAFAAIEHLRQPVIAAVNGYAYGGGCELALACDLRIASERARFAQPEVTLGITPGFGGTQRLPRTVGASAAMRMILTGKPIDAEEALRIGLVDAIHPPETLLEEAMALAETIAAAAPLAVQAAKAAIRDGLDHTLDEGIAIEANSFAECFATEDQQEAMSAFVEKRKPDRFKGK